MEEYGESKDKDYPRGRGYGNDYMRGGEVFGGYGYQERADYDRSRGEESREQDASREGGEGERAERGATPPDDPGGGADADVERFPQDERAGGWDVPHDLVEDPDAPVHEAATKPEQPPQPTTEPDPASSASQVGAGAPEPQIEYTFGDTGGNRFHSRSYYVTQAQLQRRIYGREEEEEEG